MTNRFTSNLPAQLNGPINAVEKLLRREYGAVFACRDGVPPDRIVFRDDDDVARFQARLSVKKATMGGFQLELQRSAMEHLLRAVSDAERVGLTISPRGGDSAKRIYSQTIELWLSRVLPALDHWTALGRLTEEEAASVRNASPFDQVERVLKLEQSGIWFAKDLSKSIIYSVAPPGSSQHLSMLAFDAKEFQDAHVREILANYGWFQTVVSDLPHFTFLGSTREELPDLGLKMVRSGGQEFWIPDLASDGGA